MHLSEINWFAVLLCGVASMIVGFLWYGLFFQKAWVALIKKTEEELAAMQKGAAKAYMFSFISYLVMAVILANVFIAVKAEGILDAISWAFLLWLGIAAVTRLEGVFYEKRPGKLFLINTFFNLVMMTLFAVILTIL